ncbi:MAG TPA: 5-(carboxyamino)imidazole ribonucleotide synthase, partial [Candidatus Saccharimonadales bacterium]|nr:5-(carboxyamino)imidazole ribonucleotide synthase [Candidatus Saccharimonadales bacterium]
MKNRIGIVGGGQLARMLIFEAKKMGFMVTVLDPTPQSPGGQVADKQIIASLNDFEAMQELAKNSDYITFDWELADANLLEQFEQEGITVHPSSTTLRMIQDKLIQKEFLQKNNIPVAPFKSLETKEDIYKIGKDFGYPMLLKTRFGGYDGKGNFVIKDEKQIDYAMNVLKGKSLYVEKFVPFIKEISVIIARNVSGKIQTYPVAENIHKNNILHTTIAPARINTSLKKKAEKLARDVMHYLQGAGVFGIEMFLTKTGKILVNEIAPRVHNSG